MEHKTIRVYSEKEGKMVDIEVISKDEKRTPPPSVMLVVDEEE